MTHQIRSFTGRLLETDIMKLAKEYNATYDEIETLSNYDAHPGSECPRCNESWLECLRSDEYRVTDAHYSHKLQEMVCFYCYESETSYGNGTVIIFRPQWNEVEKWIQNDLEDMKFVASDVYEHNVADLEQSDFEFESTDEICDITFEYIKSDAWRGSNQPKADGWTLFHEDGILGFSLNADKLKEFNDLVTRLLWAAKIDSAVVIGLTSNVFYQTYSLYTETEIPADLTKFIEILKLTLRDPEEYSLTALTGHSAQHTETELKFHQYALRILNGESFTEIMEEIEALA